MKKYKVVIFDIDGTLLDFVKAERIGIKKTLSQFNFRYDDEVLDSYKEINDMYWKRLERGEVKKNDLVLLRFQSLFNKFGFNADVKKFNQCYKEHLSSGSYLLENALEILTYLKAKIDITLVIITNGFTEIQMKRIELSKLNEYFNHIYVSEAVGYNKPQKEIFEHVFADLGIEVEKESTIIIGDSLTSDIKGGNDFGIDTCWINPSKRISEQTIIATYEIENLIQLKKIL